MIRFARVVPGFPSQPMPDLSSHKQIFPPRHHRARTAEPLARGLAALRCGATAEARHPAGCWHLGFVEVGGRLVFVWFGVVLGVFRVVLGGVGWVV